MKKLNVFPLIILLVFCFFLLWTRLFYLQIIQGKGNRKLSQENRIKVIKIPANRGVIYDRKGTILVRNTPEGREYLYGPVLAHVLGYIAQISEEELADSEYSLGDIVGKTGIEKYYDQTLRGKDGGIIVETDVHGKTMREIKRYEPKEGSSLTLTIDLGLQKKALEVLEERKGAVVVSNPNNGQILALTSSPSFDANVFTLKDKEESSVKERSLTAVLTDSSQPMFNRVIAGLYPPGSIFKIVTAIAGLEEGKIDKSTLVEDTGEIKIERYGQEYSYANWYYTQYGSKEGMVDIIKAIKRSNDIYFYKTGEWLGIEQLIDWSRYFGLGQPLGIDLAGEASGLVPTPQWKKEQKTEAWYLGDTYITAIGQGNLLLTPLQVNQLSSVVANNNQLCVPYLLKDKKEDCFSMDINSSNLALVKEGMKQACQEKGTAPIFADFRPEVGCKTGTAEFGDPQDQTHAWFSVFAPIEKPEILVTVLLEKAGEGSKEAAPVAKKILEYWFRER